MPSDSDTSVPLQTNILEWSPEQHSPGLLSHIIGIGHVTFFFKGSCRGPAPVDPGNSKGGRRWRGKTCLLIDIRLD